MRLPGSRGRQRKTACGPHDSVTQKGLSEYLRKMTLFLAGVLLSCGGETGSQVGNPVHVAAASSLQFVLPEVGTHYQLATGNKVTFSFAASGSISRQISRGAPIDLFCSADSRFVRELEAKGAIYPESAATFAFGRLVLAVNSGAGPGNLEELTSAAYPDIGMANPDLAPYGRAAKEALLATGIWESVAEKVVYGENVAQVLAYLSRGNISCAFLPHHLARWEELGYTEVDPNLYDPIEHLLVIPVSAGNSSGGRSFAAFVLSLKGRGILQNHGLRLPDVGER